MILVVGGDSFMYGSELASPSNTYAAILSKENNMKCVNVSWPGNANNAITRMTLSKCQELKAQQEKIAVLITWTFVQRFEFRFNYNTKQSLSPWYSINSWTIENDAKKIETQFNHFDRDILNSHLTNIATARETGIADFAKTFYKHIGNNEYYELYTTFREIVFMQNYLKLNNIPYIFISADLAFKDHPNYLRSKDTYLADLYDQIDWGRWYFFPQGTEANQTQVSRGFYQWAVENKYKVGTTHPLEQAHSDAAELIKEKFNELVTKNL